MKKFFLLLTTVMLLVSSHSFALAQQQSSSETVIPKTLFVNGVRTVLMDEEEQIKSCLVHDGEVYVPLKAFVSSLGGEYAYDEQTRTITIQLPAQAAAQPTPTANPRVDITAENIHDYFRIRIEITNIKDTTQKIQGMPFNDVTADLILTCYPVVACDSYNVSFKVTANFNSSWVKSHLGWIKESFYVSLPSNGTYTATKELRSCEIRYSMHVQESSAWFSALGGNSTSGKVESVSGYIILK